MSCFVGCNMSSQIDYRELLYRKVFSLDEHGSTYYQSLFRYVSLLVSEVEKDELSEKIVEFRRKFLNADEIAPTFFDLEDSFYNMKVYGKKFIKIRTTSGFTRIYFHEIARELNTIQSWCFDKLFEVQKSIRFTNVNANVV